MKVIVFSGPTIAPAKVREELRALSRGELECDARPPAAKGDVLDAALEEPNVIALIDGYFDGVPSVWHKEIVWAMSRGIHVFGAASMGALRAAELSAFGMQGIGQIFNAYQSGIITDDDEVAVAHADESSSFRRSSDALVNIRATLAAARDAGIIDRVESDGLFRAGKSLPYWERNYASLLRRSEAALSASSRDKLGLWLERGRIDQKLDDALLLLATLVKERARLAEPMVSELAFSHTQAWEVLCREVAARRQSLEGAASFHGEAPEWLDELLLADHFDATFAGAMARALAARNTGTQEPPGVAAVSSCVDEFRRERGLLSTEEFQSWIEQQHLGERELQSFFRGEAELRRARETLAGQLHAPLIAQLRADGRFGTMLARCSDKREQLERHGLYRPVLDDVRMTEAELWKWYFESLLGTGLPPDLDTYAEARGVDVDRLRHAVLRECCYLRLQARQS
jgi:hypothetical protein